MTRFAPQHSRPAPNPRCGATLLVTLGILTVLSVLAVSFLVSSRLHRQTTASRQYRFAARNHIDEGLHLAMKMVEESFTYPNYTGKDEKIGSGEYLTTQRLAPVGHWFSDDFAIVNDFSEDIAFQGHDVLASPASSNSPTVNLLSPKVLSLIPPALTNGLQLSADHTPVFRSGWQTLELEAGTALSDQLRSTSARVAFAVFNCSGFLDANYFVSGPTTSKLPRVCFSQADITNWLPKARSTQPDYFNALEDVLNLDDPNESPFSHLSYDPNPDIYPLHYDCYETCSTLGTFAFGSGLVIDFNAPLMGQILQGIQNVAQGDVLNKICFWKFNINSLTNHLRLGTATDTASPWYNDATFKSRWLMPVTELTRMMTHEEPSTTRHRLPSNVALPWSIANFMDEDSIPQISTFTKDADTGFQQLATRVNYAVEDVPLINKITVFNIFEDPPEGHDADYYDVDSSLSNHYAVAVELWYPFVPKQPHDDPACYVGIYTNSADIVTTTNRPWTQDLLRDWLRWNYDETSNTVMQTLFYAWGNRYVNTVGPSIWAHPLWLTVTTDSDLWFTTAMTNHIYWPESGTNATYDITATPIWQAFYPETYEEVETNLYADVSSQGGIVTTNYYDVVTTNVYTTLVETNTVLDWVEPPGNTTNRMINAFEGQTTSDYPWILWHNTGEDIYSTNRMTGFELADGTTSTLSETNLLTAFYFMGGSLWVVVTNTTDGTVIENEVNTLYLQGDTTNVLAVSSTNFVFSEEINRVQPLPMPENLGIILDGLMSTLPTNTVDDLYTHLMTTPEDLDSSEWDKLLGTISRIPGIYDSLFPSLGEPSLGNMDDDDRFELQLQSGMRETDNGDIVCSNSDNTTPSEYSGCFWTVYPKQTVKFMSVTPVTQGNETLYATNYHALGASEPYRPNTIWIRPVTTLRANQTSTETETATGLQDVIVDEALLSSSGNVPVHGWTAVTNMYCLDPRQNAYIGTWRPFPDGKTWQEPNIRSTALTAVRELPFVHYNKPFSSIGEIGHIYASYTNVTNRAVSNEATEGMRFYDTITFSTRSGAALLDVFTIHPTNAPMHGLVQANTQQRPVVKALLSDVAVGWTNSDGTAVQMLLRKDLDPKVKNWADVYTDALTNAPYSMGWRSYADMLPNISTNQTLRSKNIWDNGDLHPMHDYTEDVLRGLVDKVSFRQNIFVIIVAAQALSPASSATRPIVLADQRAAITVIRDAYTGRWTIHSWTWLTD